MISWLQIGGPVSSAKATINLSASVVPSSAAIGTAIGTLSVTDGIGTYTFALATNPGGLFAITGNVLFVNGALSVGSDAISIQANSSGSIITQPFLITVVAPSYVPTYVLLGF